jgi:hypothetical protein
VTNRILAIGEDHFTWITPFAVTLTRKDLFIIRLSPPPSSVVILLLFGKFVAFEEIHISIFPPPPDVVVACTSYVIVYTPAFAKVILVPDVVIPSLNTVFGKLIVFTAFATGLVCVLLLKNLP